MEIKDFEIDENDLKEQLEQLNHAFIKTKEVEVGDVKFSLEYYKMLANEKRKKEEEGQIVTIIIGLSDNIPTMYAYSVPLGEGERELYNEIDLLCKYGIQVYGANVRSRKTMESVDEMQKKIEEKDNEIKQLKQQLNELKK